MKKIKVRYIELGILLVSILALAYAAKFMNPLPQTISGNTPVVSESVDTDTEDTATTQSTPTDGTIQDFDGQSYMYVSGAWIPCEPDMDAEASQQFLESVRSMIYFGE